MAASIFGYSVSITKNGKRDCETNYPTLHSVDRQRNISEENRRTYATELLDSYYGFGLPYLRGAIEKSFKSKITQNAMKNLAVELPLLNKFMREISRVYLVNPTRRFFIDGKEILAEKPNDIVRPEKYVIDEDLFTILNEDISPRARGKTNERRV